VGISVSQGRRRGGGRPGRGSRTRHNRLRPLLTSVECLPPHSFTHQYPPLTSTTYRRLAPTARSFFNCVCRDFTTARCALDSSPSRSGPRKPFKTPEKNSDQFSNLPFQKKALLTALIKF